MRDDRMYLADMLEAISRIEKYAAKGRAAYEADELIQSWIVHHVQIIGEAAGKISEPLRTTYSNVPWAVIKATRNILVHSYFGVDLDKVWQMVEKDIPVLKCQLEAIKVELDTTFTA